MFTFRPETEFASFHPHRLMYTHSSPQDQQYVTFSKRFKTEPKQDQKGAGDDSRAYGSRSSLKHASTAKKIQYFDLDLTHLTSVDSSTQEKLESVWRSNKNQSFTQVKQHLMQSKVSFNNTISNTSYKPRSSLPREKTDPNRIFNIEDFLDKQNLKELWGPVLPSDNKRLKTVQNSQSIKYRYPQHKNFHKPQPKAIFPSKKPNNSGDLRVKKIEKTLVDKLGNEYRMTIEKM